MKTLELKLKKDVLIVDLEDNEATHIKGYEFLCEGSELTEETASELAFNGFNISKNKKVYVDHYDECNCFESAVKSIISYVRIEGFYWLEKECNNQFCENGKVDVGYNTFLNCQVCEEAEEKTFRNPLIFVKK